jgi:hypothetical protein
VLALASTIAVVAVLATPGAATGARVYGGSLGPPARAPVFPDPFYLTTADGGSTITGLGLTVSVLCLPDAFPITVATRRIVPASALPPGGEAPAGVLVVDRAGGGRFSATMTQPGRFGERIDLSLTGRLTRRRARGILRARITTGDQARTCDSPGLRWRTARAPGRIYAGNIPGVGLVVIRRDKRELDVLPGFYADCRPSSWLRAAVRLLLDSRRGRFADRFAGAIGLDHDYRYDLKGRIGRRRASGTFALRIRRYSEGSVVSRCSVAPTRWSARTG